MSTVAINVVEASGKVLDYLAALASGFEVVLFDDLWRANGQASGYDSARVEEHLSWERQKGSYVIVELRQLQLDQFNPDALTAHRCAKDIPPFSSDASHGWPLIEGKIDLVRCNNLYFPKGNEKGDYYEPYHQASMGNIKAYGPTPLIAAWRCLLVSKLGPTVQVPAALIQSQEADADDSSTAFRDRP